MLPPQTMIDGGGNPELGREALSPATPAAPSASSEGASAAPPVPAATATEPSRELPSREDPSLVVIGGRASADPEPDDVPELIRASRAERARRQTADKAVVVITDENLAEYAAEGRLTIAAPRRSDEEIEAAAEQLKQFNDDERYWRERVRTIRQEWRDAYDRIEQLEERAAELRTRFYAEDDPVRRDREVKPEWDRTLDQLDEARRQVERSQEQLSAVIQEGRRAGALEGWLREGIELQPRPTEEEADEEHDPGGAQSCQSAPRLSAAPPRRLRKRPLAPRRARVRRHQAARCSTSRPGAVR